MATIITLANQKGGVGKTTTTSALVSGLTLNNKRVLGLDLDPQGNLGFSLGLEIESCDTVYEVLKGQVPITKAIQCTEFGDIIPSNILLSGAEQEFTKPGREYMLKHLLSTIEHLYDYIIIDTPPSLNVLTFNAFVVSDKIIVPMVPEILSLLGLSQLKETVDTVKKYYNERLEVLGILLTKFNKRITLTKEVSEMAQKIADQLDTVVFEAKIRSGIVAAEAPAHGISLLSYAPKSNISLDYLAFVDEVLATLDAEAKEKLKK